MLKKDEESSDSELSNDVKVPDSKRINGYNLFQRGGSLESFPMKGANNLLMYN